MVEGQLYVAVSRVRHRRDIRVLTEERRLRDGDAHVLNIVFDQLLNLHSTVVAQEPVRPPSPTVSICGGDDSDASVEL